MSTTQPEAARWYAVDIDGAATLCVDQADAEQVAKTAQAAWPHLGPHRAVQLVEVSQAFTASDMATAAAQGFRDGQAAQPAVAAGWMEERENLRKALQFYADGEHFIKSDDSAWDTVSGEPQNYWCDEAGTATVEDGSIARLALEGRPIRFEDDDSAPCSIY